MKLKILQLLGFLIAGGIFSYIINLLLLRFSKSLGIRNKNDVFVRWSNESKPSLGGVSFYIVFIFSAVAYSIIFSNDNIFQNKQYIGLFIAGTLAFAMGLADDAYNTKPLFKLFIQILCGFLFVWTDTLIHVSTNFYLDAAATVIWVVIIMNSLNMLDNMDGITATVVLSILFSCLFSNWIITDFNTSIWSISMIAVIGAVSGFLMYNIHPSKLFMGDAGSQFIGLFVAFFAIHDLWNSGIESGSVNWLSAFIVMVAFTPAAVDTLTVVINRLRKGQSPMVGGKDHTTHHLVYAGLNDRTVWYVFLAISCVSTILTVLMLQLLKLKLDIAIAFFALYTVIVFIVLYRNTLKYPSKK